MYFGQGDECNMAFHFPLMPRMFMAIQMEDRFPVVDILEETPQIPPACQWGIFLRNHDELTLEMVTDEERDYMYRVYAHDRQARINLGIRRRLAPLLGNDRRKIALRNVLLFTLPGTPVSYYGDEIGMGDNIYLGDRNGVRTPMQWSADMNAGFSRTTPQKLYLPVIIEPKFHYEVVNVENQEGDPASLLWWLRRQIFLRKQFKVFGRGSIEFVQTGSEKVLAYVRRYEKESVLVVANLSRKPQAVDLDLSPFNGYTPVEMVGGTPFPDVGHSPYRLTLGAHGYHIFSLVEKARPAEIAPSQMVQLATQRGLGEVFEGRLKSVLETAALPPHLISSRWFAGKARRIERVAILDVAETRDHLKSPLYNLILEVEYSEGLPETYFLPLAFLTDEELAGLPEAARPKALARVQTPSGTGSLCEVSSSADYGKAELQALAARRVVRGTKGSIAHLPSPEFRKFFPPPYPGEWEVRALGAEQSNSTFVCGEKAIIKLMRRVEEGTQPEVEIGRFLTRRGFQSTPAFLGHAEYQQEEREPVVLAIAEAFVRNEGDAWKLFSTEFEDFAEKVSQGQQDGVLGSLQPDEHLLALSRSRKLGRLFELASPLFAENVRLLGRRTAEFHRALASDPDDPDFAPEPFGYLSLTSLAQSMINASHRALLLASKAKLADTEEAGALQTLLANRERIAKTFERLKGLKVDSVRCRIHGDYHLGQVLYTGKDFVIIDYEGEPARALGERRLKRSPLRDVAGMIRSFHYVAVSALIRDRETRQYAGHPRMAEWARLWYRAVASEYLASYLEAVKETRLVPGDDAVLGAMLDAYLLEKALYELGYELNSRPGWAAIPLQGTLETLGLGAGPPSAPAPP